MKSEKRFSLDRLATTATLATTRPKSKKTAKSIAKPAAPPLPAPFPSGKYNGKSLGQWNAWVEAAPEKPGSQRLERLARVPEPLQDHVLGHLKTVDSLRRLRK